MFDLLFYLLIFIIPVYLYLKLRDRVNPLEYLKLKSNILNSILSGFLISAIFIIVLIVKHISMPQKHVNLNIGILWISGLMVGFLEEIPFRGFVLQKLLNCMNFWLANIVTTLLFVIIHMPVWLFSHVDIKNSAITVCIASLILGYLFKEYKSLWVPIICHSIFNISTWIGLR